MTLTENSSSVTNDTQGPQTSTPPEIHVGTSSMSEHGTKTTLVATSTSVFLLLGGIVQPGNTYFCILNVTGQV